jgi:hypothetical protein
LLYFISASAAGCDSSQRDVCFTLLAHRLRAVMLFIYLNEELLR